jgi:hypothetical protein
VKTLCCNKVEGRTPKQLLKEVRRHNPRGWI